MFALRRTLLLLPLLTSPALALPVQDADALYREGVDLWEKGQKEQALERFTRVLAADPGNQAAYELWKSTEADIILQMLVEGGQYEIVARRFLDIATLARKERSEDEDAIRALLREINGEDALVRRRAVLKLASDHGEYAVPYTLPTLADPDAEDRRVYFMQALTQMDADVVLPLVAALDADDAYLRRNVAIVLGHIADPRAAAKLTWLVRNDADQGVRTAAKEAAMRCGSGGDALALFLQLGDDYHHRRASVLRPGLTSDVVWTWRDGELASTPVPGYLYADELSKNAYYEALAATPSSLDARAGLARAYVAQQAQLEARAMAGMEDDDLAAKLAEASVAISAAGVDALDRALAWSVAASDLETAIALCRTLGQLASEPTPSLWTAFHDGDGALAGEAAVALGEIAFANNGQAPAPVVAGLGKAAGVEVLRMVVVIDGDAQRGQRVADGLAARHMIADLWPGGIRGLNFLRRVPGVDAIVLADVLPDITADQVLAEIARDERTASVPVLLVSTDTAAAEDAFGDRVAGVIAGEGAAALDAIEEAMSEGLGGDRDRANDLAARAAATLHLLARGSGRTDLGPALDALAGTLVARPDSVTVPAMGALGAAGTPAQVGALLAVLVDDARSVEARVSAADAIGEIAARTRMMPDDDAVAAFGAVLGSGTDLAVRQAAARALGRMSLTPSQRADVARLSRVDLGE